MRDDEFEWDDAKARRNLTKHKVSFVVARLVFLDQSAFDEIDDRFHYDEERSLRIGMARHGLIAVIYTVRDGRTRILSARKATKNEQDRYHTQDA